MSKKKITVITLQNVRNYSNMNTPMIAIYLNEYSNRLASILKLVGLENRHLTDYNDFSFVEDTAVEFTRVNEIL